MTAFLVFTGVTTRGAILSRAGHRIVGTIVGVVAGVLLAAEIGRHPAIQIVVLVVCVFFAFYLASVAHFWLTFFVATPKVGECDAGARLTSAARISLSPSAVGADPRR